MLSSTTSFDWSQPQQMNGTAENPGRPMPSSFQIKTSNTSVVDGRKPPGTATAADQQAAAAAAPLKCPRCDSSNTKFCYYNNYSLSQPRHFCKACKRYWTRGGTLRNVPVGGGCRKTKQRVRQPTIKPPTTGQRNGHDNGPDQAARSKDLMLNGLLYGKNSINMDIFNGFGASRVMDSELDARANSSPGYNNQIHNLGLGFSPGDYMNQSNPSSYFSTYSTLFGSGLSSPFPSGSIYSAPPLIRSSTLGSGFEYEKFVNETSTLNKGHMGNFQSALAMEDMHIGGNGQGFGREMKAGELGQKKINQMGSSSPSNEDPSLHNWNDGVSSNMNTWPEAASNMGSSVMSLL